MLLYKKEWLERRRAQEFNSVKPLYILLVCFIVLIGLDESFDLTKNQTTFSLTFEQFNDGTLLDCDDIVGSISRGIVAWHLVCFSEQYLGNARILPLVFSLSILPLTYLLTNQICKRPFISLAATIGVVINPVFQIYNDTSTLHQFWVVWFLLSLYTVKKFPLLSAPFYAL